MTLKIGLIGTGAICRNRILPAVASSKDWKVIAAYDPNPDAMHGLASEYGIEKFCRNIDDFFNLSLDAVYIATPNNVHSVYAVRAMEHGWAVFVEKPCADTLSNALEILSASQRTKRPALVGYMSKFNRFNQKAVELVQSGAIGRALAMSSGFGFICSDANGWRFSKSESGMGVMGDLMTYQVATAIDVFGDRRAICSAVTYPWKDPILTDRTVMARIDMEGGIKINLDATFDREACYYTLIGEEGGIEVSGSWYQGGGGRISLWNGEGRGEFKLEEVNPYAEEFAFFKRVIAGEAKPGFLSVERAVADMKILDALCRSAAGGGVSTPAN